MLSITTVILLLVVILLFRVQSVSASASIQIQACLPNPSDENNEYIELLNPNPEAIDISNYQLDDEPNAGSKPYKIPIGTLISASSTLRFPKSQTNIALNNSKQKDQSYADMVRLLDTSGNVIDSLTYYTTQTDILVSHAPSPTSVPVATFTPTPQPTFQPATPTPKPKPIFSSTPVPVSETPVQVLSVVAQSSFIPVTPTPQSQSSTTSRVHSSSTHIAPVLIILGGGVLALGIYLTRYTIQI